MTITSAPAAAVLSPSAAAMPGAAHESTGQSGAAFAAQLSGLTSPAQSLVSRRAAAKDESKEQDKDGEQSASVTAAGFPAFLAQTLPLELHLVVPQANAPASRTTANGTKTNTASAVAADTAVPSGDTPAAVAALAAVAQATSAAAAQATSDTAAQATSAAAAQATSAAAAQATSAAAAQGTPDAAVAAASTAPLTSLPNQPADGAEGASPATAQAQNSTGSGPAAQPPDELAFAVRVHPAETADRSGLSAGMATAAVISSTRKVTEADESAPAGKADAHLFMQPSVTGFERNPESSSAAVSSSSPSAASAAGAAHASAEARSEAAESAPQTSAPLKDLTLQLTRPGNDKVDVRVVQQSGEVHISVRSGDTDLVHGLRQGLSDLAGRLEENGYRAETWRPATAAASLSQAAETRNSSGNSKGGDGQSSQGGSQQEGGRRNQQNPSNQPRWVQELQSSLNSGGPSSGESYGFSS